MNWCGAGTATLLLELYDAEFARDGRLPRRAPCGKDLYIGPSAHRRPERGGSHRPRPNAIAQRLMAPPRRRVGARGGPAGAAPRTFGRNCSPSPAAGDQALDQLALAVRADWVNVAWIPTAPGRSPGRSAALRGDPAWPPCRPTWRRAVNANAPALGLPPLKN